MHILVESLRGMAVGLDLHASSAGLRAHIYQRVIAPRVIMAKHGLAIDLRHFPAAKHAEGVGKGPIHCRGDLAGGAHRERANVLMLDRKCERPFFPQDRELLACFLGARSSLDPI
jgi:hypothetical protein